MKVQDMSNNDKNKSLKFEIIAKDSKNSKTETEISIKGVIFHIYRSSIIDRMVIIKTTEEEWPENVKIRLYFYTDVLYIDNGYIFLKTAGRGVPGEKNKSVRFGELPENQKSLDEIPFSHPYWINVTYYEDYTELSIPNNLLGNNIKSFNVSWATFVK